jgi:16S rRNA C967 or C1407 C5-methylase (RsmB/RsmF family)/NOL1/NOP2/fmu family ribosome biogenesis protein
MGRRNQQFPHGKHTVNWESVLGPTLLGMDCLELDQLTRALLQHSPRCIRVRDNDCGAELPFATTSVPWFHRGQWLKDPEVRPSAYLNYAAGDYYIQDAASLLALELCQISPGDRVCDICAAPGGKSTGILEQLQGSGYLVANEVIRSRLDLLEIALCRSGWGNFITTQTDAVVLTDRLQPIFDCVLIDAPCSGQSLVGRKQQSMASFGETQIAHNASRQERILRSASSLVRPGGRLVYSTCTFSVAENELTIERFLDANPEWRIWEHPELAEWSSPLMPGCYRLWPHRDRCDGAFAVALTLPTGPPRSSLQSHSQPFSQRTRWQDVRLATQQLSFLDADHFESDSYSLRTDGKSIHLFASTIESEPITLARSGLPVASLGNGGWEPCYGSSVCRHPLLDSAQTISLTDELAKRFVAGESLRFPQESYSAGWCRVHWNGKPLSWGKRTGAILKNHFPKMLRLRIN